MLCVAWSHDSSQDGYEFQYFTLGTEAEMWREAQEFARSLGVDPECGFVTIQRASGNRPVHPERK